MYTLHAPLSRPLVSSSWACMPPPWEAFPDRHRAWLLPPPWERPLSSEQVHPQLSGSDLAVPRRAPGGRGPAVGFLLGISASIGAAETVSVPLVPRPLYQNSLQTPTLRLQTLAERDACAHSPGRPRLHAVVVSEAGAAPSGHGDSLHLSFRSLNPRSRNLRLREDPLSKGQSRRPHRHPLPLPCP